MHRQRANAPTVLWGLALTVSAGMLLALMSGLTFFQDSWGLLLDRQEFTARAFFMPHNEHIVVLPAAIEMLLIAVFGMTTAAPEQLVMVAAVLASATLLFVYVRRRLGPWPALIAGTLFLFLGPAWADMIWPFQIGFVGSMLFGIAMLLALDHGDRRRDVAACGFLTLSIGFSSLGLSFVAAAATDVFMRRRSHGLSRIYVVAIPALLYAVWWLGWGHEAERHVTWTNLLSAPRYAMEGFASAVEALLGLNKATAEAAVPPDWGVPILIALIALVAYGQMRRRGVSSRLWPVAAAAGTNWLLAGANFIPGREAYQNRYMYAGAAFVLLLATELLRDVRIGRRGLMVAGGVATMAVLSNLVAFKEGGRWLEDQTLLTRANLAAIEIAERTVDPAFSLSPEVAGTGSLAIVSAGKYLPLAHDHGSPAYSPDELARAPQVARRQADMVLSQALPITTKTRSGSMPPAFARWKRCVHLRGGTASRYMEVPLTAGVATLSIAPGPPADLAMRRFAKGEFPVELDRAPGGSVTFLQIPRDRVSLPWYLHVEAAQPTRICT